MVLGGGTGTATVAAGLARAGCDVTAVTGVWDDGGSTGELRRRLDLPPFGDLRQCISALAGEQEREILEYRFDGDLLAGHAVGNLLLAGAVRVSRTFTDAAVSVCTMLGTRGVAVPVSDEATTLVAHSRGRRIEGELRIWQSELAPREVTLELGPRVRVTGAVRHALLTSDLIVVAPGSFYTSIAPLLLVDGVVEAVTAARARVCMVANLTNKASHAAGFTCGDYVSELERIASAELVDVVVRCDELPHDLGTSGAVPLQGVEEFGDFNRPVELRSAPLVRPGPPDAPPETPSHDGQFLRTNLRHDGDAVARVLLDVLADGTRGPT